MRLIRDLPIRRKLIVLMLIVASASAILTGLGSIAFKFYRYQSNAVYAVSSIAELIGKASAAAVAFNDRETATELLSASRVRPSIINACLYTPDGKIFAEYRANPANVPPPWQESGHRFERYDIIVFQPVKLGNDVVGTIAVRSSLREQRLFLLSGIGAICVVILLTICVALLLSRKLQKFAADPILELAQTAQAISENQDYSMRVPVRSRDEIGLLTGNFNDMLAQIQKSEEATRASEEQFRQLAENIREVFWLTNVEKTEMLYVSPAYEHIWGRPTGSLYAAPMTWLDAIHPEDRERVRQAAMTKQKEGTYDEEYRVVRPDGAVRWIHDRAFPVADAEGAIYRIAGIAEDVTERKRLQHQVLEISDREQRRIGHDLHDGLCQHLTGTGMMVKALERELTEAKHPAAAKLSYIRDLVSQAVGQGRAMAHGLSPVHLAANGLSMGLQQLAEGIELQTGISCTFEGTPFETIQDNLIATHLYRIAQEAVNNAIRHGQAKHVRIGLHCNSDHGWLTVTDDGIGISPSRRGEGMGMHIMADRAQMIGGALIVSAGKNGGTVVTCSFKQKPQPKGKEQKP